jgi:hypothetical protein
MLLFFFLIFTHAENLFASNFILFVYILWDFDGYQLKSRNGFYFSTRYFFRLGYYCRMPFM